MLTGLVLGSMDSIALVCGIVSLACLTTDPTHQIYFCLCNFFTAAF